jgi:beta-N-acetylhexosaminidase
MERMRQLGQLFLFGFEGLEPNPHILRMIREYGIGGVILFSRNIRDPRQTARLIQSLHEPSETPLFIGIDEEGGRVSRLCAPFTAYPGNRAVGLSGSPELAYDFGQALAEELLAVGINLDFAPVLDVDTRPENPVIGTRAFGDDPEQVAALGCALIRGLQENGVLACGKHFPGHGDTALDSHHDLPRVPHGAARLRQIEMVPFARAIAASVETLMTAHVVYTGIDADRPATLSPRLIQRLLREELGFNGVVFSDDLEMKAVAAPWGVEQSCVLALQAGVDVLTICHDPVQQEKGLRAVMRAVEEGEVSRERIEGSLGRILDLKRRRLGKPFKADPEAIRKHVGSEAHRKLAARMEGYLRA